MSRMLRASVLLLLLALTIAACVHSPRTTPPASMTAQTGKKAPVAPSKAATPARPTGPTSAAPAGPAPEAAPVIAIPPPGFGGLAWGVSSGSYPGLAPYEADAGAGVTTCIWPQGPKDILGAPIRDAYYEFFQDHFYHVWINFDGMAAYKAALAGLIRAYGPPAKEIPEKYYHAWAIGDVNIYCAYHPGENEGDVSFFYQPIYERMMAARKTAQAKRAPGAKARP